MNINYLTAKEIASIIKTTIKGVIQLLNNAGIPYNRYRRRVIVKAEDLESIIRKNDISDLTIQQHQDICSMIVVDEIYNQE